jgi:two-component system response regulator YesN
MLGLDLVARHYLVAILKIELGDRSEQYDYDEFQRVQRVVMRVAEKDPDVFLLKRDWGDLILVMKGNTPEYLEEECELLLGQIKRAVAKTHYQVVVGTGTPKKRIADICQSFVEALANIQNLNGNGKSGLNQVVERAELLKVDKSAFENYLHSGAKDGFGEFFEAHLRPVGETALKSNLVKNYVFVDIVLAVARLVKELGGEVDEVIPELNSIEMIMSNVATIEQMREQTQKIICRALAYRDSHPHGQYKDLIRHARKYIEHHYTDPELSLNAVASHVNLSASHFSVVFSQEAGQTFKEYLIETRINKAKELLRMTSLRSADIAYQVGYNDPHYFSSVFKKNTGLTPMEFRARI